MCAVTAGSAMLALLNGILGHCGYYSDLLLMYENSGNIYYVEGKI